MALPHPWGRNDLGAQMLPPVSPLSPGVTLRGTHSPPPPPTNSLGTKTARVCLALLLSAA